MRHIYCIRILFFMAAGSVHKGVEKGDRKGSLGSKSFADTLASRQGQTLHDFYRIEPEISEHVINWSVRAFLPVAPRLYPCSLGHVQKTYVLTHVVRVFWVRSSIVLDILILPQTASAKPLCATRMLVKWICGRFARHFSCSIRICATG